MKFMFIGAHPDDGDSCTGGIAARYVERGGQAMLVSITNGNAGHQQMQPAELAARRKAEAKRAGEVIGAEYVVLDNDDGRLTPTVEVREEIIRLVRQFHPDLLCTVRPFDYHADHRAAGQLVMDASYLLTVPLICPDAPIMERMPVIAYTLDRFTKPLPFLPDVAVAVDEYFEQKVRMMACHESQYFEWLAFNAGHLDEVPAGREERLAWLRGRCEQRLGYPAKAYRGKLIERYGTERANEIRYAEVFEICEYGRQPDGPLIEELFPK
jgi:LmbE family N-acetylglucosaminyl deacetylase